MRKKKHFTLQICWKNWFVSYRKNKKKVLKTHSNVCLRASQLRRCCDTGAWTHRALFFRQQELQLFPSCTIITAADPNRRASSNLSHRARRGTHLSVSPAEGNRRSCRHYEDEVLHHKWAGYAVWTSSNIKGASGIQLWGATSVKSGALVCPACLWICCLCWKLEVQLDSWNTSRLFLSFKLLSPPYQKQELSWSYTLSKELQQRSRWPCSQWE